MAGCSVILGCFMALLILLYTISKVARYYIKYAFFILGCVIATTVPLPLMFLKPRHPDNALIPSWFCRQVAKMMGISWEVRGIENIDNSGGAVVLMNHQSALDLIVLSAIWPYTERGTVISKRALFYLWPFGLAIYLWGTVFIDRQHKQKAQTVINSAVDAIKSRKARIFLFPEGTRHSGEKLLPFKKGAFHAAIDASCPIQPIVISRYHYLDSDRYVFNKGHFTINILPEVSTEGLTKDDLPDLVDKCYAIMQQKYSEVSAETLMTEGNNNNNLAMYKMQM